MYVSSGRRVTRRSEATIRRAHRDVGHEVAVHDIDMDPIGASSLRLGHLLASTGKVRCEDRRREFHALPSNVSTNSR